MNINSTLVGQGLVIFACIMLVLGFILGKRKTEHPFISAIIGFFSGFFPPFALVFFLVLILRKDINAKPE